MEHGPNYKYFVIPGIIFLITHRPYPDCPQLTKQILIVGWACCIWQVWCLILLQYQFRHKNHLGKSTPLFKKSSHQSGPYSYYVVPIKFAKHHSLGGIWGTSHYTFTSKLQCYIEIFYTGDFAFFGFPTRISHRVFPHLFVWPHGGSIGHNVCILIHGICKPTQNRGTPLYKHYYMASGKITRCYWTWPLAVDSPLNS